MSFCAPPFITPLASRPQVVGDARYQSQEDFKREIAILRACRDPNIVAFLVSPPIEFIELGMNLLSRI